MILYPPAVPHGTLPRSGWAGPVVSIHCEPLSRADNPLNRAISYAQFSRNRSHTPALSRRRVFNESGELHIFDARPDAIDFGDLINHLRRVKLPCSVL